MTRSNKTSIIVALFIVAAVVAGTAGYFLRERTRATLSEMASLSASASETRQDLLSLYRSRLDRDKVLLEVLEAPGIKPEWADTQIWRAETAADLAALDQQQTAISSHLASVISQTEPLAKPELTFPKDSPLGKRIEKARAAFRDYERFEQDMVRKRRFYFGIAQKHEAPRAKVSRCGTAPRAHSAAQERSQCLREMGMMRFLGGESGSRKDYPGSARRGHGVVREYFASAAFQGLPGKPSPVSPHCQALEIHHHLMKVRRCGTAPRVKRMAAERGPGLSPVSRGRVFAHPPANTARHGLFYGLTTHRNLKECPSNA